MILDTSCWCFQSDADDRLPLTVQCVIVDLNRCSLMTPASSSTVAMFHRRVSRRGSPMACYLARRAVRRRTSSAVAWVHSAVSADAPCRSCRTGHSSLRSHASTSRRMIERRWLMLLLAINDRRRMSGSNRCLQPVDATGHSRWTWNGVARRQSPSSTPCFLELFWLERLTVLRSPSPPREYWSTVSTVELRPLT